MFYELALLSVGNMLRARARLLMTAGGVLVGTTAVILLIALTIGLQTAAESAIGNNAALTQIDVWPNYEMMGRGGGGGEDDSAEGDVPKLDIETVRRFWQIPNVAAVIPTVYLQGGQLAAGDYFGYGSVVGIDPALLPYLNLAPTQGTLSLNPGEVIVGKYVAESFYDPNSEEWSPITVDLFAQPISLVLYQYSSEMPSERDVDLNIVGEFAEGTPYDYTILMPIEDVVRFNEWITGTQFDPETFVFDQVSVRASDRKTVNQISDTIREMGFSVGGMGDYLNSLNSFFGTMRVMLGGVGGVALLVAAFGVANTMTMAILERTKEIGLMKAIGATDRNVLTIFLVESGLVGLVGGLSGISLSLFLQNVINRAIENLPQDSSGIQFLPINPEQIGGNLIIIPTELIVFALILATAVGFCAGFYPSLSAANLPPVIALKSE